MGLAGRSVPPRVDFGVSKDSCHFELAPSASCCCELSAIPAAMASAWPSQTLALWNHKPKLALCSLGHLGHGVFIVAIEK